VNEAEIIERLVEAVRKEERDVACELWLGVWWRDSKRGQEFGCQNVNRV